MHQNDYVHENFALLAENEKSSFFQEWFDNAARGDFPKKFSYYNGELSYMKKRNSVFRIKFLPEDKSSVEELKKFILSHSKCITNNSCSRIKVMRTEEMIQKHAISLFKNKVVFRKKLLREYFHEYDENVINQLNTIFLSDQINVDNFIFENYHIVDVKNIDIERDGVINIKPKSKRVKQPLFGCYQKWSYQPKKPKHDFNEQLKKIFPVSKEKQSENRSFFPKTDTETTV